MCCPLPLITVIPVKKCNYCLLQGFIGLALVFWCLGIAFALSTESEICENSLNLVSIVIIRGFSNLMLYFLQNSE